MAPPKYPMAPPPPQRFAPIQPRPQFQQPRVVPMQPTLNPQPMQPVNRGYVPQMGSIPNQNATSFAPAPVRVYSPTNVTTNINNTTNITDTTNIINKTTNVQYGGGTAYYNGYYNGWGNPPQVWVNTPLYNCDGYYSCREKMGWGKTLAYAALSGLAQGTAEALINRAYGTTWYPNYQVYQPTWTPATYGNYVTGQPTVDLIQQYFYLESMANQAQMRGDYMGAQYQMQQANACWYNLTQRPPGELDNAYRMLSEMPRTPQNEWEMNAVYRLMTHQY